MTIKEIDTLNTIKNEILYSLTLDKLSNVELLKIIEETIDIEEFDLSTISDFDKKFLIDEVEGYINTHTDFSRLENIIEYIQKKDYPLDAFLGAIDYIENDLNLISLTQQEVIYIADELELSISEYEYQLELHNLEEELSSIDNKYNELEALAYESNIDTVDIYGHNEIKSLIEDKNRLLEEIQTLKDNHSKIDREALIKEIQAKKYISPKELNILFPDMSISSQQTYRGRLRDKIPYNQKKKRGKITYTVSEVKEWIENQNWKHK